MPSQIMLYCNLAKVKSGSSFFLPDDPLFILLFDIADNTTVMLKARDPPSTYIIVRVILKTVEGWRTICLMTLTVIWHRSQGSVHTQSLLTT